MCHGLSGSSGLGMFTSGCGIESPCLLVKLEIDGGEAGESKRNLMKNHPFRVKGVSLGEFFCCLFPFLSYNGCLARTILPFLLGFTVVSIDSIGFPDIY